MNFLETFLSAALIAILTGLTVLARNNPNAYKKLYAMIFGLSLFLLTYFFSRDIAIGEAYVSFLKLIKPEDLEKAKLIFKELKYPYWTIYVAAVINLYLCFLLYLPSILGRKNSD